ncbi:MAG: hypothetical protein WBQ89_00320, partial [Candidatus Acidiferrum sp.]
GQVGLNAGILPSPGFTYLNIDENYDAGTFNGPKGNAIPVTGTYNVWAIETFSITYPTPNSSAVIGIRHHVSYSRNGFSRCRHQCSRRAQPTFVTRPTIS